MSTRHSRAAELIREMRGMRRCDLSALLRDAAAFGSVTELLAHPFRDDRIELVVGLEAAGLPLAGAVAGRLGSGVVLLRRRGRAAWTAVEAVCRDYSGSEKAFEVVEDAVRPGQRCLVIDDWSETGEQLALARRLVESLGGVVAGCGCVNVDRRVHVHPGLSGLKLVSALQLD